MARRPPMALRPMPRAVCCFWAFTEVYWIFSASWREPHPCEIRSSPKAISGIVQAQDQRIARTGFVPRDGKSRVWRPAIPSPMSPRYAEANTSIFQAWISSIGSTLPKVRPARVLRKSAPHTAERRRILGLVRFEGSIAALILHGAVPRRSNPGPEREQRSSAQQWQRRHRDSAKT